MKISGKHLLFILGLTITILFSCSQNNLNEKSDKLKSIKDDSLSLRNPEKIFKNWIKDTLPYFKRWESKKEKDIIKKEIILGDDSLSLKTYAYYSTYVDHKVKPTREVYNIIELLKEYDELPSKNIKLSFLYYMFYQPSSVEQLEYDFINEIKDLKILEDDSEITFDIIRGRLSGKELKKTKGDGKQSIIKTDFVWNGDTLVKIKR